MFRAVYDYIEAGDLQSRAVPDASPTATGSRAVRGDPAKPPRRDSWIGV